METCRIILIKNQTNISKGHHGLYMVSRIQLIRKAAKGIRFEHERVDHTCMMVAIIPCISRPFIQMIDE